MDCVPEIEFSGTSAEKWDQINLNKAFLHFLHENEMKKSLVQLGLNPFLNGTLETRVS